MVHPRDVNLFEFNRDAVIMADNSQEARYIITDVEQLFFVGHGQVRSSYGNSFTMKLSEPNGTTFLESIALTARRLGIENHLQAKYYIVVEFNGRLPDGRARKDPAKFIYAVTFKNIQMQIDAGGTQYNIEAVETATSGFNYLEQVIRSQITVDCNTVGEFISEFLRKWAKSLDNELMYNINAAYADTYDIQFDQETETDDWLSWPIQQATEEFPQGPNRVGDKMQFTIPNGSNLSDIVGMVLMATAEYKRIATERGGFMRPTPSEPVSLDLDEFPLFYKIVPNIEFGQYDPLRGDYVKNITFKVKKHILTDRVFDSFQYTNGITDRTIQANRVNNMFSNDLLRKRYDYIFTGLNTEIINLDLKLDNQYYEISVVGNGQTGDPTTMASSAGRSAATIHEALQITKSAISQITDTIDRLQRERSSDEIDDSRADEIDSQIEELIEERTEKQNQLDEQLAAFDSLTSQVPPANGNFLSAQEASSEISMRLRFAGDIVDDSDIYGPESDTQGGTLQFGAVKANLENSADMLKIEMTIRGDPYWMGQPNSFHRDTIGQASESLADYEAGGVNFFLNVLFPVDENSQGRRIPRVDYTLSGVYRVSKVINRFSGGTFIQYLDAVRDLATNTATALSNLDQRVVSNDSNVVNSSSSVTPTTTSDPAQTQESGANE